MSTFVSVLQEPVENIVKLRTTPPLFQAYEYAYSLLENSLCPLFHESDDVSNVIRIITMYQLSCNLPSVNLEYTVWILGTLLVVFPHLWESLDIIICLSHYMLHYPVGHIASLTSFNKAYSEYSSPRKMCTVFIISYDFCNFLMKHFYIERFLNQKFFIGPVKKLIQ